jgi:hypothetical protein
MYIGKNESTIKSAATKIPANPQLRANFSNNANAENVSNIPNTNSALAIEN